MWWNSCAFFSKNKIIIFIWITIIGMILCFALVCILGTKDDNEMIKDDEEQLKYIEKWKNKKGIK